MPKRKTREWLEEIPGQQQLDEAFVREYFFLPRGLEFKPVVLLPAYHATGKKAPKPRAGMLLDEQGHELRLDFVAEARKPWKRPRDRPMTTPPGPDTYTVETIEEV